MERWPRSRRHRRHNGPFFHRHRHRIRGPRAVEPLMEALKDVEPDVRSSATKALGELKDPRAVEPLCIALRDSAVFVRQSAADALGNIKDPRSVERLIAAMADSDFLVRSDVIGALGKIKDPRAIAPLIAVLQAGNPTIGGTQRVRLLKLESPPSNPSLLPR